MAERGRECCSRNIKREGPMRVSKRRANATSVARVVTRARCSAHEMKIRLPDFIDFSSFYRTMAGMSEAATRDFAIGTASDMKEKSSSPRI